MSHSTYPHTFVPAGAGVFPRASTRLFKETLAVVGLVLVIGLVAMLLLAGGPLGPHGAAAAAGTSAPVEGRIFANEEAEKVFGQAEAPMKPRAVPASFKATFAAGDTSQGRRITLPRTAAPAAQQAMIGVGLTALGAYLLLFTGRLRRARRNGRS